MVKFRYLELATERYCYGVEDIRSNDTLTVKELINVLNQYDDDLPVILSNDNGYTYGRITEEDFSEEECTMEEDDE